MGLVSPAGVLDDAGIQQRVAKLESLGYKVRLGEHVRARYGGYAGTPLQRAADLHGMFSDRDVRAIWAARGGSGCLQLLPLLDYELARRRPRILVGFSDITALHLALHSRAGLVTFHAPTAGSSYPQYSADNLRTVLEGGTPTFALSEEQLQRAERVPALRPRTVNPGTAEGRLWGGNLSMVSAMMGTPYLADPPAALLFLEEVGEAPYRVDRMLTQLRHAGLLRRAAGLLLGVFHRCEPPDNEPSISLAEAIDDNLGATSRPAVYGYSFGHVAHQYTLPVGIRARLDTEARTVRLLEPAVV